MLNGQAGSTYAVDVSSNLLDWSQLITFTNTTGSYQFTDTSSTNNVRGYYRAPDHNARSFTDDGYFRTGALARRTRDGNVVVTGHA